MTLPEGMILKLWHQLLLMFQKWFMKICLMRIEICTL